MTALAGVASALGPKVKPGRGGSWAASLTGPRSRPAPAATGPRSTADGVQVGALRAGESTSTRRPTARSAGRCTMPSISGASCTVRPRPGASTRTWRVRADEGVALGRGDGVLQLGALAQALEGELGRHLVGQPGGVGAVLVGEGEEAGPVELGRVEELEQQVVVALGLARVAEDERGAEGGVGLGGPDVGDAAQEALAVAPAPHAGEMRARHVLEGEVEVGHARVRGRPRSARRSGRTDRGRAAGCARPAPTRRG